MTLGKQALVPTASNATRFHYPLPVLLQQLGTVQRGITVWLLPEYTNFFEAFENSVTYFLVENANNWSFKRSMSSYHMKGDYQVFSFITSEEESDVSELRTRKQWKPTASRPSWVVMNKRTSFGSKYAITMPNRSSQNSQRTISYPLVQVRQEVEQKDNHLRWHIMWHVWIQMTRCFPSNHLQQTSPVYSCSKQRPKLWPTDRKLSTKCWFIFTVTNGTKDSLIRKINP